MFVLSTRPTSLDVVTRAAEGFRAVGLSSSTVYPGVHGALTQLLYILKQIVLTKLRSWSCGIYCSCWFHSIWSTGCVLFQQSTWDIDEPGAPGGSGRKIEVIRLLRWPEREHGLMYAEEVKVEEQDDKECSAHIQTTNRVTCNVPMAVVPSPRLPLRSQRTIGALRIKYFPAS